MTDWAEVTDGEPGELYVVRDQETLRLLSDPLRTRIIAALQERALTAKELAPLLGVPQTRLYHHLHKLTEAGLIRIVETRQVSGITERRYRTRAYRFTVARSLFEPIDDETGERLEAAGRLDPRVAGEAFDLFLDMVLDGAKATMRRAVREGYADPSKGEAVEDGGLILGRVWAWLAPQDLAEVAEAVRRLLDKLHDLNDPEHPEAKPYEMLVSFAAMPPSLPNPGDSTTPPPSRTKSRPRRTQGT